ncbi:hypothetical protein [Hydrogenophaga sp.]|uniref:hypothetical protein n=1 Tax=Hydrogenophaga sp. TaxID=1904254 RepID=UPI002727F20A|nr:hypothetical protein [Hydrogenophaga sp.]MDO9436719.1 hypothetical protein [Hydrogenophaga sp.]
MNDSLDRLARQIDLHAAGHERLRMAFGHACVMRVKHLLEDPAVVECLDGLGRFLEGTLDETQRERLAAKASRLATGHQGSKSIDGCGHAAVSATYAVANALAGKALQAADYAAYALVYAEGGYGAVAERGSFEREFEWQVRCLAALDEDARANADDTR